MSGLFRPCFRASFACCFVYTSFRGLSFSLDVDQDPSTGDPPPSSFAGRDFSVTYSPLLDTNSPLSARVIEYPSRQTVDRVPFSFTEDSVSAVVPLALLKGDDGVMNVGMNTSFMGPNLITPPS